MIILGFVLDYLIMMMLPISSFFVIADIDKNNFLSVLLVGILLDLMFHKLLFNVIILVSIYLILKFMNRLRYKNIILYVVYFNISFWLFGHSLNILYGFIIGGVLQFIYLKLSKVLLK